MTRCARDSDWCDGATCTRNGIFCVNADAPAGHDRDLEAALEAGHARRTSGWMFNQPHSPLEAMSVARVGDGTRVELLAIPVSGTGFVP